jgi:colanic acid/amylovoran biosynthesis glycosyltransferase
MLKLITMTGSKNKTVVGHFIRGFLHSTETFVGNQIAALERYEPAVFCHHLIHGHSFPSIKVTAVDEMLPPMQQMLQKSCYKLFRGMTPFAANQLAHSMKQSGASLLHFHYLVDARFFLPVLRRLKLPSVVSGYGWDVSLFPHTKFGYSYYYLQPIFQEMDLFLAMSDDMKKDLMKIGCPEQKILVHYFGNEIDRFVFPERQYENKRILSILFCARLAAKKAPQLVLQALKRLEDAGRNLPDWRLVFVGEGNLRGQLETIVKGYEWNNKVEFAGHIPYHNAKYVEKYKNADIYILPSMTVNDEKEGIPGSLIEAMASGLPCISSYHAGIPTVITPELDGFLTQEGDTQEIANVLEKLLLDNTIRKRIGKAAAMKAIQSFNIKERTKQLENIYDSLIIARRNLSNY